jgi:hypothetical protein
MSDKETISNDNKNIKIDKVIKKKKKKDIVYAEEQKKIFEELKKLLNVDKDESFTSDDTEKAKEAILKDILPKVKLFYHSNLWYSATASDCTKPKAYMTLIRKIIAHFDCTLSYKAFFVRNEKNERVKKMRYYIINIKKE